MSTPATPGDIFAALFAGHHAGDYWAQRPAQAAAKGLPGRRGRLACARHVASVTACKAATLGVLRASGRRVCWKRAAAALAADAASHYWTDRRTTLEALAVRAGKEEFYRLEGGAALLDQAFHIACLWLASAAAAGRPVRNTTTRR